MTDVFRLRRGVCQDFARLEIACLRALGLAARYSGSPCRRALLLGEPSRVQDVEACYAQDAFLSAARTLPRHPLIKAASTSVVLSGGAAVALVRTPPGSK